MWAEVPACGKCCALKLDESTGEKGTPGTQAGRRAGPAGLLQSTGLEGPQRRGRGGRDGRPAAAVGCVAPGPLPVKPSARGGGRSLNVSFVLPHKTVATDTGFLSPSYVASAGTTVAHHLSDEGGFRDRRRVRRVPGLVSHFSQCRRGEEGRGQELAQTRSLSLSGIHRRHVAPL